MYTLGSEVTSGSFDKEHLVFRLSPTQAMEDKRKTMGVRSCDFRWLQCRNETATNEPTA